MLQQCCVAVLRACYGIDALLCGNAEHMLWQWCMAVCAHSAALTHYGVHDKSLQYSQEKNSSTHLLAIQMPQLEENMPQELGLSKRSKLLNMRLASLVADWEVHPEVKI